MIVGTVRRARLASARKAVRRAGGELLDIGRATRKGGHVELITKGKARRVRDEGWTHLR